MRFRAQFFSALPLVLANAIGLTLTACSTPSSSAVVPEGVSPIAPSAASRDLKFRTIVNPADRTFNEALGINDGRTVAGYYGNGAAGHPSQGYTAVPPFQKEDFTGENYPGASQTQVTAINRSGDTAGVWRDSSGAAHGFIDWNGVFAGYDDPNATGGTQILGLNDSGIAVGFYVDSSNERRGFSLDRATGTFTTISVSGATSVTAAGINDNGDIVGYYSTEYENVGFLRKNGNSTTVVYPGALLTTALGVNSHDAVVGAYVDPEGKTHGFLLQHPFNGPAYDSIDDRQGVGTTTLNGINDRLNMVGYYVNSSGDTMGILVERKKM